MTDTQRIELMRASISRIQVQRVALYQTLDALLEQFDATFATEEEAILARGQIRGQIDRVRNTLTDLEAEENRYKQNLEALKTIIELEPIPEPEEPEDVEEGDPEEVPIEEDGGEE